MRGQLYPFCLRILEDRLIFELNFLKKLKNYKKDSEDWVISNVNSCEHRIEELKQGIEHLKTLTE